MSERDAARVAAEVAQPARVYDYLLGGSDHFPVDRDAAEASFGRFPGGVDGARANARANRAFLVRAVRWLAAEAGARQFLDVGSGIPSGDRGDNVHEVAQAVAPEARVVYVDNDPLVHALADARVRSTPEGAVAFVPGDLRDPDAVLAGAAATLDLSRPVALVLVGVLHFVPDEQGAYAAVARLVDALAPGSHLALSHLGSDVRPEAMEATATDLHRALGVGVLRSAGEVARFFAGLELVAPGLVPATRWHPDPDPAPGGTAPTADIAVHCAVARKP